MCVRDIYNTARKSAANGGVGFPLEARNHGGADCKLADTIREDWGGEYPAHSERSMRLRALRSGALDISRPRGAGVSAVYL